jgi:hypothetical protein
MSMATCALCVAPQTNCVTIDGPFSPRVPKWTVSTQRRPLLHTFNFPLGAPWGSHVFEVASAPVLTPMGNNTFRGNLSLTDKGGWHLTAAAASAHSFFVEDILEELTVPGEWYVRACVRACMCVRVQ